MLGWLLRHPKPDFPTAQKSGITSQTGGGVSVQGLTTTASILVALALPAGAQTILPVEFVKVEATPLTYDAALTGTINAKDSVEIGFRLGGRIMSVDVRVGDEVKKGQALARTDPLQQVQALRVAQAAEAAAAATWEQARQAQIRAEAMLSRGVGTRAALDSANQSLSAAAGALTQAKSTLGQAQRALADTVLRAPHNAIVTTRNAEVGQIVGAAQTVLGLASQSGREAVFRTPDTPLLRHAIGAPVTLAGIDVPDLQMTAYVSEISPIVDPGTGSVTVRATIKDAPTNSNLLGAAVHGAIHYPAGTGVAVPWTALTSTGDSPAVWLVDANGRVAMTPIGIERFSNGTVILNSGVSPGQIVVGAGSQLLYPGRQVQDAATIPKGSP